MALLYYFLLLYIKKCDCFLCKSLNVVSLKPPWTVRASFGSYWAQVKQVRQKVTPKVLLSLFKKENFSTQVKKIISIGHIYKKKKEEEKQKLAKKKNAFWEIT